MTYTKGPWALRGVQIRADHGKGAHVGTYISNGADGVLMARASEMFEALRTWREVRLQFGYALIPTLDNLLVSIETQLNPTFLGRLPQRGRTGTPVASSADETSEGFPPTPSLVRDVIAQIEALSDEELRAQIQTLWNEQARRKGIGPDIVRTTEEIAGNVAALLDALLKDHLPLETLHHLVSRAATHPVALLPDDPDEPDYDAWHRTTFDWARRLVRGYWSGTRKRIDPKTKI